MIPFKLGRDWTLAASGRASRLLVVHWCIPRGATFQSFAFGCPNCGIKIPDEVAHRACWYAGFQGCEPEPLGRLAWKLRVDKKPRSNH